jgi:ligand-binding SRPBCC domain-containing protein
MRIHTLAQEQRLPISRQEAWTFFSSPGNLGEITPPDIDFQVINEPGDSIFNGQVIVYRIGILPLLRVTWVTEIKCVDDGLSFIDEQRFGPYKFWHHRHSFKEIPGGVLMRDLVHYGLGFGPFGGIAHGLFVRRKLESIFGFRRKMLEDRFGKL